MVTAGPENFGFALCRRVPETANGFFWGENGGGRLAFTNTLPRNFRVVDFFSELVIVKICKGVSAIGLDVAGGWRVYRPITLPACAYSLLSNPSCRVA